MSRGGNRPDRVTRASGPSQAYIPAGTNNNPAFPPEPGNSKIYRHMASGPSDMTVHDGENWANYKPPANWGKQNADEFNRFQQPSQLHESDHAREEHKMCHIPFRKPSDPIQRPIILKIRNRQKKNEGETYPLNNNEIQRNGTPQDGGAFGRDGGAFGRRMFPEQNEPGAGGIDTDPSGQPHLYDNQGNRLDLRGTFPGEQQGPSRRGHYNPKRGFSEQSELDDNGRRYPQQRDSRGRYPQPSEFDGNGSGGRFPPQRGFTDRSEFNNQRGRFPSKQEFPGQSESYDHRRQFPQQQREFFNSEQPYNGRGPYSNQRLQSNRQPLKFPNSNGQQRGFSGRQGQSKLQARYQNNNSQQPLRKSSKGNDCRKICARICKPCIPICRPRVRPCIPICPPSDANFSQQSSSNPRKPQVSQKEINLGPPIMLRGKDSFGFPRLPKCFIMPNNNNEDVSCFSAEIDPLEPFAKSAGERSIVETEQDKLQRILCPPGQKKFLARTRPRRMGPTRKPTVETLLPPPRNKR